MSRVFLLIAMFFSGTVLSNSWDDISNKKVLFSGEKIKLVRVHESALYVVVGNKLLYLRTIESKPDDITSLYGIKSASDISDIKFNLENNKMWITLNGNEYHAKCFENKRIFNIYNYVRECKDKSPITYWEGIYPESKKMGGVMAQDYDEESSTFVISVFKGGTFYFNDENPSGKVLWNPKNYYDWSKDVAVSTKYAFSIGERKSLIVRSLVDNKVIRYSSKNRIRTLDSNDVNLFIGSKGLHIIDLRKLL